MYYKNCSAVRAAGADPIYAGDPGYSRKLDRDGDGIGCESKPPVKRVVCSEAISLWCRLASKGAGFHFVQATMPLPLLPTPEGVLGLPATP
ncbi:excalibur calcium-binding domain-containing protein [Paenibacillus sp. IHBB 3054]|uniref:excalibur calcium-binding domain-containing protein n=1 Tax=Paenibacillus sp. IHBB 3054 TaxID=3425689 RepID=UPI003F67CAEA